MAKIGLVVLGVVIVVLTAIFTAVYTAMTPQSLIDYSYVLYVIGAIILILGFVLGRKKKTEMPATQPAPQVGP